MPGLKKCLKNEKGVLIDMYNFSPHSRFENTKSLKNLFFFFSTKIKVLILKMRRRR